MTAGQIAQLVIETDTASAAAAVEARCAGAWTVQGIARLEQRLAGLSWPGAGEVVIDGSAISALDTSGAWLLQRTIRALEQRGRQVRINGLRSEFSALLRLIAACAVTPEHAAPAKAGLLEGIGQRTWRALALEDSHS